MQVEKAKESKSQYIPVYRSGPYAVLLTLYKHAQVSYFYTSDPFISVD